MPANKDLKRLVRARMRKTGESYTAARVHVIAARPMTPPKARPAAAAPAVPLFATLAGMSDAAIKAKTGCSWDRWVFALDRHGAESMPHRDIARLVHDKYKVNGWWGQTVTVGYERIKGLRAIGQRRDGSFEANKSRTVAASAAAVYRAWTHGPARARWLDGAACTVRAKTPHRSVRLAWPDGGVVAVWLTAKGPAKTAVAVQHARLPDRDTVDRMKRWWTERLAGLDEFLTRRSSARV